jgi:hypothetical protein
VGNVTTLVDQVRDKIHFSLDELARRGAQRMLIAALEAEVDEYISRHSQERDENGHALVVVSRFASETTAVLRNGLSTVGLAA